MEKTILGLHHITCIASNPQANLDFYTKVFGLRLVKLTVNFDDPGTYHFYFGDEAGAPGTLMTFFPWVGAYRGRAGVGQATATAFAIPVGSAEFWIERLAQLNAAGARELPNRFGEKVVGLEDPDGLPLELIEAFNDSRQGWSRHGVPAEKAIRGFHSVTLTESKLDQTADLLSQTMDLRLVGEERERYRFAAGDGTAGTLIDVRVAPSEARGTQGAGTVHHVALRTPNDADHAAWHETISGLGYGISPIIDRTYFHSIYFHEPGGVLLEIATDPPGMAVDESISDLGHALVLPMQYESYRERIEQELPKLDLGNDHD
jgi:glyoxalase family protein